MEVICLSDFNPKLNRRGRPLGKSQVAKTPRLCLHDLAFMRAALQGIDLQRAGERFLPELHADMRVVRAHMAGLCGQAMTVLRGLGQQAEALSLGRCLQIRTPNEQPPDRGYSTSAPGVPSLIEFAEQLDDPDAWSESELLEMYQECYPQSGASVDRPAPESQSSDLQLALRGLKLIQTEGVRLPNLQDEIHAWLSPALCSRLAAAGILHLNDLTWFINVRGKHWYRTVPGVGRSRADRLVHWLQDHVNFLEPVLGHAAPAMVRRELIIDEVSAGALRSEGANALGAHTDWQAIQSWIATLDFLSPCTRKAYTRDVMRFLLWAQDDLHKGLADITVLDAVAHAHFLQSPPKHWCRASHYRNSSRQLTMRGALSPSSSARALAAIGHFYGFLVETQYLKANPFARVRRPKDRGIQMDVQRCFSNAHLQLISQTLEEMHESPRKRRLKAILALMECTGIRIGEIPPTWASIVEQFDAERGAVTCLKVLGKGGRERLMPLRTEALQALQVHAKDQLLQELPTAERPLIGSIETRRDVNLGHGALSAGRLRTVLKAFFREVAQRCQDTDLAAEFLRATPHFMRHTFAHRVLQATQQDLAVTQQLLGHKSIATTGIYVKANLAQRLTAIQALSIQTSKGANP